MTTLSSVTPCSAGPWPPDGPARLPHGDARAPKLVDAARAAAVVAVRPPMPTLVSGPRLPVHAAATIASPTATAEPRQTLRATALRVTAFSVTALTREAGCPRPWRAARRCRPGAGPPRAASR